MNEKRPKISVIVPVYNTEKYLHQCLDTIINQTLKETEIICVDDGSTDNSLQILKEYQKNDARIIILKQNNGGGAKARNNGIEISTGEYLAFLDSDDFFDLKFLEKMYNQALSDDADVVGCEADTYDIRDNKLSPYFRISGEYIPNKIPFSYLDLPKYIFVTLQTIPWNKLYRREMVLHYKLRFQEVHHYNDNYFSLMAVVFAKKITLVKEPLVYYRIGMRTNTQSRIYEHPLDFVLVISAIRDTLIEYNLYKTLEQGFLNYVLRFILFQDKKLRESTSHEFVYNYIQTVLFEEYGINNHDINYYYNKLDYLKYEYIKNRSYSQFIDMNISKILHFIINNPQIGFDTILYLKIQFIRNMMRMGLKWTLKKSVNVIFNR